MNFNKKADLSAKMLVCNHTLKNLLRQIQEIEDDTVTLANDKLSKIKKIQEEISKVGDQIDILKKEITLINSYNVN